MIYTTITQEDPTSYTASQLLQLEDVFVFPSAQDTVVCSSIYMAQMAGEILEPGLETKSKQQMDGAHESNCPDDYLGTPESISSPFFIDDLSTMDSLKRNEQQNDALKFNTPESSTDAGEDTLTFAKQNSRNVLDDADAHCMSNLGIAIFFNVNFDQDEDSNMHGNPVWEDLVNIEQQKDSITNRNLCCPMISEKDKRRYLRQQKSGLKFEYEPVMGPLLAKTEIYKEILSKSRKGSYRCALCSERFSNMIKFAIHLDANKIERRFKCPFENCAYCILGFLRRAELKRHIVSQHERPARIKACFVCEYDNCHKSFKRKDSLVRHQKLCHLNINSRFNVRQGRDNNQKSPRRLKASAAIPSEIIAVENNSYAGDGLSDMLSLGDGISILHDQYVSQYMDLSSL